ncbi:MAG: hypothetical protein Q7S23_03080 [bacterium]|nr:hypothetical protein [bacterium]
MAKKSVIRSSFGVAVLVSTLSLLLATYPGVAAAPQGVGDYPDAVQRQAATFAAAPKVVRKVRVVVTAYNSLPEQTDSTPCITASGYNLCQADEENVVAANFLRFGTKVRLPDYSGEKVYTVQDRMHPRFDRRMDLWMRERSDARKFGLRTLTVEVLE